MADGKNEERPELHTSKEMKQEMDVYEINGYVKTVREININKIKRTGEINDKYNNSCKGGVIQMRIAERSNGCEHDW